MRARLIVSMPYTAPRFRNFCFRSLSIPAAIGAGLFLSACVTAGGETRQALDEALVQNGYVEEVYVSAEEGAGVSAAFAEDLSRQIERQLADCATGDRPLRMDVMLGRVKRANPLVSAVVTDTNSLDGHIQIYDLETGAPAGEYDLSWEGRGGLGAGGALLMAATGQMQMTDGFADEICRIVFEGEDGATQTKLDPLPF